MSMQGTWEIGQSNGVLSKEVAALLEVSYTRGFTVHNSPAHSIHSLVLAVKLLHILQKIEHCKIAIDYDKKGRLSLQCLNPSTSRCSIVIDSSWGKTHPRSSITHMANH